MIMDRLSFLLLLVNSMTFYEQVHADPCRTKGEGCTAKHLCCNGLTCDFVVGHAGFCQAGVGGAPSPTSLPPVQTNYPPINGSLISKSEFVNTVVQNGYPAPIDASSAKQGDATWYDVGLGACGWSNNNDEYVAAVSPKVYGSQANPNNSPICGKTAVVHYGEKSVSVKIVDKCMGCRRDEDIDLSLSAFEKLAGKEVGRIPVFWKIKGSGGGSDGGSLQVHADPCRTKGEGCTAKHLCCNGLTCDFVVGHAGFCQAGGGGAPSPTSVPPVQTNYPLINGSLISKSEFVNAVVQNGYPTPTDEQYNDIIARAEPSGRITTKRELAMFLANILHESDGLRAKSEYNPPAGAYIHPPLDVPGQRYYGRGYIQLSWSYNYKKASQALFRDDRLLHNPNQVATDDEIAWDVSFWYWSEYVHDKPGISAGEFGISIQSINGGLECGQGAVNAAHARRRFSMYQVIYRVFGISGTPNEHGCYN